jgi:hypothetical protein
MSPRARPSEESAVADNPATATTERTFTEAEVQERIRAATSTTQSDLRAAAMERDLYKRQVTTAEGAQTDAERLLGQAKATIDALQKAEGMTDDIVSWSNWKGQKEAEIASARTDLDRQARKVEIGNLSARYGVPEVALANASSPEEMVRIALDHVHANPPASADPLAPASATSAVPVGTPAATAAAPVNPMPPSPEPDRGGAGNTGNTSTARGKDRIQEHLAQDPAWRAFAEQFPDTL